MVAAVSDPMLSATIDRMVGQFAVGVLSRTELVASIVSAAAETRLERTTAEREAEQAARYLAKFDEYGGDRWAAGRVGGHFGQDPIQCQHIAQHVRALVRARKAGREARPRGRPQNKAN